jgi:hypothetical protein
MFPDSPPPVDTIELLLREIAERLRKHAERPAPPPRRAALALLGLLAACGPSSALDPAAIGASGVIPREANGPTPPCVQASDCPAEFSICDPQQHACARCDGDYDSQATHRCGSAAPICDRGNCVQCLDNTACEDFLGVCRGQKCDACKSDSECSTGRCHADGTCASPSAVLYVDHEHACRDEVHASSATDPYCEIAPGLPATGEAVVHLAPSDVPYYGFAVDGAAAIDVLVLGPGRDLATIESTTGPAVSMDATSGNPVRIELRGVTLEGAKDASAVRCSGKSGFATVVVSDARLTRSGEQGLSAVGCNIDLARSIVEANANGGLQLVLSIVALDHDFVVNNGGAGVSMLQSSGAMKQLTVRGNHSRFAAGVFCDASNLLATSIVVENVSDDLTGAAAQVDQRCDDAFSRLGLDCMPRFVSATDAHLDMSSPDAVAANTSCVINRGFYDTPDVDGESAKGGPDVGADEAG